MMMERAVAATGVGRIADDAVTGSIVPPQDPEAIATAALALFANPAGRAEMGRQGRDRALAHFSVDQCAMAHATAYEHALRVRAARLDDSRP
jgi:polysaccharide biosynthesis protein PelF